jgi:hypothetical protein
MLHRNKKEWSAICHYSIPSRVPVKNSVRAGFSSAKGDTRTDSGLTLTDSFLTMKYGVESQTGEGERQPQTCGSSITCAGRGVGVVGAATLSDILNAEPSVNPGA